MPLRDLPACLPSSTATTSQSCSRQSTSGAAIATRTSWMPSPPPREATNEPCTESLDDNGALRPPLPREWRRHFRTRSFAGRRCSPRLHEQLWRRPDSLETQGSHYERRRSPTADQVAEATV